MLSHVIVMLLFSMNFVSEWRPQPGSTVEKPRKNHPPTKYIIILMKCKEENILERKDGDLVAEEKDGTGEEGTSGTEAPQNQNNSHFIYSIFMHSLRYYYHQFIIPFVQVHL